MCVCVCVYHQFFFHLINDYKFLSMIFFLTPFQWEEEKKSHENMAKKKPVLKLLMNFILMERWLFCFSLVSFCNAWMNFPMHNSRTTTKIRKKTRWSMIIMMMMMGWVIFVYFTFVTVTAIYIYIFFLFVSHELIHLDFFSSQNY